MKFTVALAPVSLASLIACSGGTDTIADGPPPNGQAPSLEVLFLSPEVLSGLQRVDDSTIRLALDIDDPLDGADEYNVEISYDWSVSYDISSAAGALGPHEFVVGGIARDGDLVLEHFDLSMPGGAQVVVDTTAVPVSFSIAGGGGYLPPSQRAATNPPVREELFRGAELGTDVLFTNDPHRRFTYVCSRDLEKLFLVPWAAGAPVQEYSMGSDPALLGFAKSMRIQRHSTEGDKLRIRLDPQQSSVQYLILSDYDGDGVFDGDVPVTKEQYGSMGYPELWETDYVRHTSLLGPS